jgi:hypothetical protein
MRLSERITYLQYMMRRARPSRAGDWARLGHGSPSNAAADGAGMVLFRVAASTGPQTARYYEAPSLRVLPIRQRLPV